MVWGQRLRSASTWCRCRRASLVLSFSISTSSDTPLEPPTLAALAAMLRDSATATTLVHGGPLGSLHRGLLRPLLVERFSHGGNFLEEVRDKLLGKHRGDLGLELPSTPLL